MSVRPWALWANQEQKDPRMSPLLLCVRGIQSFCKQAEKQRTRSVGPFSKSGRVLGWAFVCFCLGHPDQRGMGAPALGCMLGWHWCGSQGDSLCPAIRTKMYLGHGYLQDLSNVPGFPHRDNPSNRLFGNMAGVNLMRIISFLHWYGEAITLSKVCAEVGTGKG